VSAGNGRCGQTSGLFLNAQAEACATRSHVLATLQTCASVTLPSEHRPPARRVLRFQKQCAGSEFAFRVAIKVGAGWCVFCGLARNAIWPGRFLRLLAASGDLNRAARPGHHSSRFPARPAALRDNSSSARALHLVGERSHAAHRVIRCDLRVRFE